MKFHRTVIGFIFGLLIALSIGACAQKSNDAFSADQVGQIQNIVHNYLVTHPQVLVEASHALQKQEITKAENAAKAAIKANATPLFDSKTAPTAGNPNGSVTLIEFFDYQCPHCVYMAPVVERLIKHNPNLKIVSMDFPIFGAVSEYAARAALAAGMQGKYWEMHNALFAANKRLSSAVVDQIATKIGLNITKLKKDMKAAAITTQINAVKNLAQQLKLAGTPAFIVGPSHFNANSDIKKLSFFPGQTSGEQLQQFIEKAK